MARLPLLREQFYVVCSRAIASSCSFFPIFLPSVFSPWPFFSYSYPSSHLSSLVPLRFLPLSVFSFCYYPYFLVISFSPFYFMFPAMVVFDNFIRVKIALTELDSEVIIIVIAATTSLRLFSFLPSITLFVTFSNLHFEQEFASLNLFFLSPFSSSCSAAVSLIFTLL